MVHKFSVADSVYLCAFLLKLMKGGGMDVFMRDTGIVMLFSNVPQHLKWEFKVKKMTYSSPLFYVFGYKSLSRDPVPCVAVLDSGIGGVVDVSNTVKIEPWPISAIWEDDEISKYRVEWVGAKTLQNWRSPPPPPPPLPILQLWISSFNENCIIFPARSWSTL
jgi:hypothetical protein